MAVVAVSPWPVESDETADCGGGFEQLSAESSGALIVLQLVRNLFEA